MKKTAIALLALLASGASLAATPWQKITHPVAGSAQSIGAFSNGCIVGAQELPLQSDTYQVMRTVISAILTWCCLFSVLATRCITWGWGRC